MHLLVCLRMGRWRPRGQNRPPAPPPPLWKRTLGQVAATPLYHYHTSTTTLSHSPPPFSPLFVSDTFLFFAVDVPLTIGIITLLLTHRKPPQSQSQSQLQPQPQPPLPPFPNQLPASAPAPAPTQGLASAPPANRCGYACALVFVYPSLQPHPPGGKQPNPHLVISTWAWVWGWS